MQEFLFGLTQHILTEPWWLQLWVFWMISLNTASLFYLKHVPARAVLAAWLVNLVFMNTLCYFNGYNRLLGLSHILFWTPLVIYLFRVRSQYPPKDSFGVWLRALLATNAVSLVVDYVDVVRYFAGDGGLD